MEDYRVARFNQLTDSQKSIVHMCEGFGSKLTEHYGYDRLALLHKGDVVSLLWINKYGLEGYIKDHDKRKALDFFKRTGRAPIEELLIRAIHEQGLKRILYFKPLPKGKVFLDKMVAKYGFRRNRFLDFLADFFCEPRTLKLPSDFLEKHKPIVPRLE